MDIQSLVPVNLNKIFADHKIVFAGLFGSRAKGESKPGSDYDFLVDFYPDQKYSLLDIVALQQELELKLKTKVDVITTRGLHKYIRDEVTKSVVPIYGSR